MELEQIKLLATAESVLNGTSLITLYLPSNTNLWLVKDHFSKELKTASNIKNKNIGKSVAEALKLVQHQLKMITILPTTGMVLCAGTYQYKDTTTNQYI